MAIALDNAQGLNGAGGSTSYTHAYTCTGSNLVLIVMALVQNGHTVTGVTYNGVAMTKQGTAQSNGAGGGEEISLWMLVNPATGSNNVVVSSDVASANFLGFLAASYTGVGQTGQPDSQAENSTASGTALTVSTTTVADNCWLVGAAKTDNTATAGSNTTLRGGGTNYAIIDTNAAQTPAGSHSMAMNASPAGAISINLISLAPPITTSIKTFNGLARASIKTVNGLALASVKKINGLA